MEAVCRPPAFMIEKKMVTLGQHVSPGSNCSCGLYAFHAVEDALGQYVSTARAVLGAAIFWGQIEIATCGFRAQYGRIVALSEHNEVTSRGITLKRGFGWTETFNRVSERYRVPIVPMDLLETYAQTFGTPFGSDYLDG